MFSAELLISPGEERRFEAAEARLLEEQLRTCLEPAQSGQAGAGPAPRLVFRDGSEFNLPPELVRTLEVAARHLSRGDAVRIVPIGTMLTSNQAAEILNVSRPHLVKLLYEGAIPFTRVGTHHRLCLEDVLEYKQRQNRQVLEALDELAREALEAGNYFDD